MAILPKVQLFMWYVRTDTCAHYFVTWMFDWSDSLHPPKQDAKSFYDEFCHDWLGVPQGSSLDRHLAEGLQSEYSEDAWAVEALRYGFWRGEQGGNIIEIVFDRGYTYPGPAKEWMQEAFTVFSGQVALPAVFATHGDRSELIDREIKVARSREDFFAQYAYRHRPPFYHELGNLEETIDHWREFGPEPSRIVDLVASPVGV